MNNVMRIADTTPEPSAKLKGLVDKLLALRAEIDATLAELEVDTNLVSGVADTRPEALTDRLAGLDHSSSNYSATSHYSSREDDDLYVATDDELLSDTNGEYAPEAAAAHEASVAHAATVTPEATDVDTSDEAVCDKPAEAADVEGVEIHAEVAEQSPPELTSEPIDPPVAAAPEGASDPAETAKLHAVNDLTRIAGIDASIAEQLNAHGVFAYEQIAAWSAADVARLSDALNIERRISQENWIEQAAVLASGTSTAFTRGPAAEPGTPASAVDDPNLRPYEHIQDALRANAAAQRTETRIISLQEERLKKTAIGAPIPGQRSPRRRGRYAAATLATGLAASLGFAAVMLVDVDEIRARAAASETLRNLIEHTKRQFEPRPEPRDVITKVDNAAPEDPDAFWIRQMCPSRSRHE